MPEVGAFVELNQGPGGWLPAIVTHVHDADTLSVVAFSGMPAQAGWHRPSGDFSHVMRGENFRQWRMPGEEAPEPAAAEPGSAPAPKAGAETNQEAEQPDDLSAIKGLGTKTAEWLAAQGVQTFAALAALTDEDAEALVADAPYGVTMAKLIIWRGAAQDMAEE